MPINAGLTEQLPTASARSGEFIELAGIDGSGGKRRMGGLGICYVLSILGRKVSIVFLKGIACPDETATNSDSDMSIGSDMDRLPKSCNGGLLEFLL